MTAQPDVAERRIVVGVDGSEPSKAALMWAIRQAGLTGARVEAVIVWHYPTYYGYGAAFAGAEDFQGLAARVLADTLADVADPDERAGIRSTVVEGNPAGGLLQAAKGAELLVVGSRGHGGFAEALLGSVGQHCVHHAACPVVVIRDGAAGF